MTSPTTPVIDDLLDPPLLRDPPPPPGYVEPLAGSSAEDTYPQQASSAPHDGRPVSRSTTLSAL